MLPAQQQSNSLPINVCPSECRLMREHVVRWFDIELNLGQKDNSFSFVLDFSFSSVFFLVVKSFMHSSAESQNECIFFPYYMRRPSSHCVVNSLLCMHLWMLLYEQPCMHHVYIHVVGEKVHYSGFCCKCASVMILL